MPRLIRVRLDLAEDVLKKLFLLSEVAYNNNPGANQYASYHSSIANAIRKALMAYVGDVDKLHANPSNLSEGWSPSTLQSLLLAHVIIGLKESELKKP